MNLTKVAEAIMDRFEADTGTGGFYHASAPIITGAHFCDASEAPTYPYVVFSFDAAQQNGTLLGSEVITVLVDFHIYALKSEGFAPVSAILDRLYGDVYAQASHIPSYGFHRFILPVTGGWSGSPMVREESESDLADKDVYHFREGYKVLISRAHA